MNCSSCNKELTHKTYPGRLCETCYKYFKNGGTINPLPELGTIANDERGYVVCHICGRAYKRLGTHVKQPHDMTIKEYKERFGLCNKTKTTEANYSRMMHDYAYQYNMPEQLRVAGENTRIKSGASIREGKTLRLQERMRLLRQLQRGSERILDL